MGGKVSCTLGEVKNRADFILYWGGNPAECHPRHFTKYTIMQKGKFIPEGRKGRTMVLVDIRETMSVKAADIFLQVRPGKDFEVITALRALVKGHRVDTALVEETGLHAALVLTIFKPSECNSMSSHTQPQNVQVACFVMVTVIVASIQAIHSGV